MHLDVQTIPSYCWCPCTGNRGRAGQAEWHQVGTLEMSAVRMVVPGGGSEGAAGAGGGAAGWEGAGWGAGCA